MLEGLGCFNFSPSGFCTVAVVTGKENGEDFFAVIAIEPENYKYFKKNYRPGERSSFRTFGHELARGWGERPDQALLDHLAEKYDIGFGVPQGFLSNFAAKLETIAPRGHRSAFVSYAYG